MAERKTGQQARQAWVFRTAAQRLTGLALLLIGLGGLWYWWQQPLPGGAHMRQAVLAGPAFCLPVGLWQILYCPRRRPPQENELPVYNSDWALPTCAVMELVVAVLLSVLPRTAKGPEDVIAVIACNVFLAVGVLAMAVLVVAVRNEGLLVTPDGRAERWTIWGWHHVVEERPAALQIKPRLGRYIVYDEAGNRLYHFDRDMVNETALLNLLQAQGVANTGTDTRQRMAHPYPKVRAVLDWDEAEWTPAHRWLPGLRRVVWLPPMALLVQWWLLQVGIPLLGLRAASLLACWLPLVFFGLYLVWPEIFVWNIYLTQPRSRYRDQILATPAWRRMHVSLMGTALPVAGALLWTTAESQVWVAVYPVRLAVLCGVLAVGLIRTCERRYPLGKTHRARERWMIWLLALFLAYPLGYSLDLALTAPASPTQGTVTAVEAPAADEEPVRLSVVWDGEDLTLSFYEEPAGLPQPGETIALCVRQSPLGIPLVARCSEGTEQKP